MKKRFYYLLALGAVLSLPESAFAGEPVVQGIPYLSTLTQPGRNVRSVTPLSDFIMPDPGSAGGDIGTFTLDSIKNWSGEGPKRAGLVIQWNTGRDHYALAFGYRFDGSPTGIDMLRCVVENNPQLYGLFQRTNVSSGNEKFGYTINGLGWDANCSGVPVTIIDTGNGDEAYTSTSGFFDHPRGCSESVSYPDYDYDNWISADPEDYWQAGWYVGYWSYWLKDGNGGFTYSGVGASGRTLSDGSWDGWNYCPDMMSREWMPVIAVPSLIPEGFTEIFTVNGITYKLKDSSNAQVIRGSEPYGGEITIPNSVTTADGTFAVTSIGSEAFAGAEITAVSIPNSINSIGKKAFANSGLTQIALPESILELKDSAFFGCSKLTDVNIPAKLTEIPVGAFAETAISKLNLPSSVSIVQSGAFKGCRSLTEIVIPEELTQLSSESFANCDAVTKVSVSATLPLTISESVFSDAAYANATLFVPDGFENGYLAAAGWKNFVHISTQILPVNVGDKFLINGIPMRITSVNPNTATVTYNHFKGSFRETAVQTANRKLSGELIIPEQITYMGQNFDVNEIQPYAFHGASSVTKVVLPANIKGFGPHIFDGCYNLTSVTLPDAITVIPDAAFSGCSKLTEIVNMPQAVDTIGESAFYGCSKITEFPFITKGLKVIGRTAFNNSGLTSISIPASVDSIGYQAFGYTKIASITIPESVTKLGQNLFYQCSQLTEASLPSSLTEIPKGTFQNCKVLATFEIPEGVTIIDDNAFYGCSKLASINLPNVLEVIGKDAFRSATSLTEVSLPETLKIIGDNAFYSCKLTSLQIPAEVDSIGKNAFYGGAFTEVTYPANVTRTGGYTFAGCASLTSVTFPDNLVAIPDGLFKDCKNLPSINIPQSCTSIGNETFSGCTALNISIPEQIEIIGRRAFYGCKAIETMSIPATVDSIGNEIFSGCTNLREVSLPDGIHAIPANMFYNCSALEKVNLGAEITSIGNYAFYGCTALDLSLPCGLEEIGSYAFTNCKLMKEFNLPETVKVIGGSAFQGCTALPDTVLIPESVTSLGGAVFQGTNLTTIYVCDPLTTAAFDYTFRTVSSWSNPVYCDVVVPFAYSDKCKELTGYMNAKTLTEPELNDVEFTLIPEVSDVTTAIITADIAPDFGAVLPERFLTACGKGFDENAKVELVYSLVKNAGSYVIRKAEEENKVEAIMNADGHYEAALENLNPGSDYAYKWRVTAGNKVIESEPRYLTTLSGDQPDGIVEILEPAVPVDVYAINGQYIGRYDSISDFNLKGIYIVRQGTTVIKLSVK